MPESLITDLKTAISDLRSKTMALLAVAMIVVIATHFATFMAMADIWLRSDTFAHGLIVGPMFLYFVFRQRQALREIDPQPYWPALLLLLLISISWIGGQVLGVNALEQFSVVAMIPVSVLALAGPAVVRTLAFPLVFLFFAVPFGEFLIPQLMRITADLTHVMLLATGFSVYREGFFITVPGGDFEIAKACSGIRYLIASIVLGTIFAYLTFNTWRKRLIFMAFSVLVPILANGIRAYMIVVLASLSDMRLAVGIDHFIYGWVFFGIVMFILFGVGVRYRDDHEESPAPTGTRSAGTGQQGPVLIVLGLALAVMLTGPALAHLIKARASTTPEVRLADVPSGWKPASASSRWQPAFAPADQSLRRALTNGSSTVFEFVDVYNAANGGVDAASSTNRLVDNKTWRIDRTLPAPDSETRLVLVRYGRNRMYVASWYQNGDKRTSSPLRAKLAEAWDTLVHGGSTSAVVAFAVDATDENRELLMEFVSAYHPALSNCLADPRATGCSG